MPQPVARQPASRSHAPPGSGRSGVRDSHTYVRAVRIACSRRSSNRDARTLQSCHCLFRLGRPRFGPATRQSGEPNLRKTRPSGACGRVLSNHPQMPRQVPKAHPGPCTADVLVKLTSDWSCPFPFRCSTTRGTLVMRSGRSRWHRLRDGYHITFLWIAGAGSA